MKKYSILILFIAISAVFTSCSEFSRGLSYAMDLQEEISEKYDSDEVEVTIKNNILRVSLIDNKISGYSKWEKQEILSEIEAIASNLENKPELSHGVVKFVTKGSNGIVKTSTSDSMQMDLENNNGN